MLYVAADSGEEGKVFEQGSHRAEKDEALSCGIRTTLLGPAGTRER